MNASSRVPLLLAASLTVLPGTGTTQAWTSAEDAVRAMHQGRCEAAVDAANKGLKEGDPHAYFVVGLMHLKGLCIAAAPAQAVQYFEPAARAAHADSAYMLVMMHGLGLGVQQSYAQAGRWTTALSDIAALKRGGADGRSTSPIDAREAFSWGVVGTVSAVVRDRLLYPKQGARTGGESVSVTLKLTVGPEGVRYELLDPTSRMQDDARSSILRRSTQPHLDAMQEVVEDAIRELPAYPATVVPVVMSIPYSFFLK